MALKHNEAEVWRGHPAWSHYLFLWFFAFIFGTRVILAVWIGYWAAAVIFGAGILLFGGLAFFLRKAASYRVTREALYLNDGVWGKGGRRFPIGEIESAEVRQTPIDRLFGIGTVVFRLRSGSYERFRGIRAPDRVCQKITALL